MMFLAKQQIPRSLLIIFSVALLARVLFLAIYGDLSFGDSDVYKKDGVNLFETGFIKSHIYTPVYPIWTYLSDSFIGLQSADILVSSLSVIVFYNVAMAITNDSKASLLTAFVSAIYPHFIFYSIAQLSETLFIFAFYSAIWVLYHKRFLFGSVLLVLCILTRPSTDFFAPVLIFLFSITVHKLGWKSTIKNMLCYLGVYLTLMSPWWIHNAIKYDSFVRLSLGDGHVLYSGNNQNNKTGGGVATGSKFDDLDTTIFDHIKDPVERNEAKKRAAITFIKDNPSEFFMLAAKKFIRFWRLWPFAPEYQKLHYILVSLLSYGCILALAMISFAGTCKKKFSKMSPLLLYTIYLCAVSMATIGSIRYRLPVEPFLIILASSYLADFLKYRPLNFIRFLMK